MGAVSVRSYRCVVLKGAQAKHSLCCRLAGLFAWSSAYVNTTIRSCDESYWSMSHTPHLHRHASRPFSDRLPRHRDSTDPNKQRGICTGISHCRGART